VGKWGPIRVVAEHSNAMYLLICVLQVSAWPSISAPVVTAACTQ